MDNASELTQDDLFSFRIDSEEAVALVKHYSAQYISKEHYELLGASCVMSATRTIDAIVGSTEYLKGAFTMPDEIHVERVAKWFVNNRNYECERSIVTFYMAHYIKRKINSLYRSINQNGFSTTLTIIGNTDARKEFQRQIKIRKNKGVKGIRV